MGIDKVKLGTTTLFSETDKRGIIQFANEEFCKISQFSKNELIGRPHNIVRHPDMPKELFANLWTTIQRGQTFHGVIKNKAKDGSHYWVEATIMPVTDNHSKILKYIGVRHLIEDDSYAMKLYQQQLI